VDENGRQELTFEAALIAQLTVIRCYAYKVTRNREEAMDLVQETYERALRFRHFFMRGLTCAPGS
jgi:DNA-directed RNA polymerase specialized sigma24 family protein